MSTLTMPQHDTINYTCDWITGKAEHRRACSASVNVRPEQGGLWLDPAALVPEGWAAVRDGHICPDCRGLDGHMASLVFNNVSDRASSLTPVQEGTDG
jgi:hypothetical protein